MVDDIPFCLTGVIRWPGPRPSSLGNVAVNPAVTLGGLGAPSGAALGGQLGALKG